MLAGDGPFVLIAAASGRALAACARRAGYRPLVADMFGDLDTQKLAEASECVPGSLGRGFDPEALLAALDRLSAGRRVLGVVTGNGFEDRTGVLQEVADHHLLLGNTPATVAAIKDPLRFAAICERAGVRHPEVRLELPAEGSWLGKRAGASGGAHIAPHPRRATPRRGRYFQRRVSGVPVSAAFLAANGACRVLGLSRQWADPAPHRPFRYGGAVRPVAIGGTRTVEITDALARLVAHTGLRGLNSADFLVREDGFDLLEVNPRPGATLDIFVDRGGTLFRLHLEACDGKLPDSAPEWPLASAALIVYAPREFELPLAFAWPEWTADRQRPGVAVRAGAPFCTVLAEAPDAEIAERLVRERAGQILAAVQARRLAAHG